MRKWPFALGLVLIFLGTILVPLSMPEKKPETTWDWKTVKTEVTSWTISSNLTEGDEVRLLIAPAQDWALYTEAALDYLPYDHKFVYLNITGPNGEENWYEITYVRTDSFMSPYNATTVNQVDNGFNVQNINSATEKALIANVEKTGLYTAKVTGFLPGGGSEPNSITLYKKTLLPTNDARTPELTLLYTGTAMLLLGAGISIWSAFGPRRKALRRKNRVRTTVT